MADISVESHEDDSVTLRVGALTAHIRAATWREANDAAQTLGGIISGRLEVQRLSAKLRGIASALSDLDDTLRRADHHMQALEAYTATPNESKDKP